MYLLWPIAIRDAVNYASEMVQTGLGWAGSRSGLVALGQNSSTGVPQNFFLIALIQIFKQR